MTINVVQTLDASAAQSSTPAIRMNQYAVPFNVGFGIYTVGAGDATVRVEHTFDEQPSAASKWFIHVDVSGVDISASAVVDGNYAYPVANVRMTLVAVSGAPVTVFRLLQTGV